MDYKKAAKEMANGRTLPVYLCYGPESYLMQSFVSLAVEKCVPPELKDFAFNRFDLSEQPVELVIEDAETLPFMADKKLIVAHDASFFTASRSGAKVEHNTDRLLEYLKSPADYSIVIFTVNADKLDERKKLVKWLKQQNAVIPFPAMGADELLRWVQRQAEQGGCRFADGAADHLILNVGTSLRNLSEEIEKLGLYAGAEGVITSDMVRRLTVRNTEQTVFMLVEEIIRLRMEQAFSIYHELLKQREDPIKILMLVARQFRIVLQVKELGRRGLTHQQTASELSLHPYAVKIAAEQAGAYDEAKLARILSELAELDFKMKSGEIDKVLAMELFLCKLAG